MNGETEVNAAIAISSYEIIPVPIKVTAAVTVRDKRTMNHMDPETKEAHLRLEEWGRETRDASNGYPSTTLLGRLIEQGPMGAGQSGKPPVSLSESASRADACVAKLCQIDQRVLRYYYQHWVGVEEVAKFMRMRVRQAQNVLRRARWRFMAHLAVAEGG